MKSFRKSFMALAAVFVATGFTTTSFLQTVSAAAGGLYFTPSTASVAINNTVTLGMRVDGAGTSLYGVKFTLAYDSAKLTFVSFDEAGSAFSTALATNNAPGALTVERGSLSGPVTTDALIGKAIFKAVAGTGSTSLTFTNLGSGLSASNSATVSFTTPTAPTPTCAAGQIGTYPNCVTPPATNPGTGSTGSSNIPKTSTGTSNSGTPPKAAGTPAAAPVTAKVSKETVQYTKAKLAITSEKPTQVYIKYGYDAQHLLLTTQPTDFATSHDVVLGGDQFKPGTKYYYSVVSKDQAGNTTETAVATVLLKGIPLKVGVFDANRKPIAGKTVVLHSDPITGKTDKNGYVTFDNVSPGAHKVVYKVGDKEHAQEIAVANTVVDSGDQESAPVQSFSIVYANYTQTYVPWARYGLYLVVLLAIGGGAFLFINRQRKIAAQPLAMHSSHVVSDAVVSGGPTVSPVNKFDEASSASSKQFDHSDQLKDIPSPSLPDPGSTFTPQQGDKDKDES